MQKNILTQRFETKGNPELLRQDRIAILASKNTPPEMHSDAFDLFDILLTLPIAVAGGWQAPLEKKCFARVNTQSRANIIYYVARNLNGYRVDLHQQSLLEMQKLCIVSPELNQTRPSKSSINRRDSLLFSQVSKVLFLHIKEGGRLENYYNFLLEKRYDVLILDSLFNTNFLTAGAIKASPEKIKDILGY